MKTGTVKFYNSSKGYGFILEDNTNKEIFVHATGLRDNQRGLNTDERVQYEEQQGKKGLNAINVDVL